MKSTLSRLAADYGIFLPLLLLCAYFSWATIGDQTAVGEAAAQQVFAAMKSDLPMAAAVLIAARDDADDLKFAARLEADLTAGGYVIAGIVRGEPTHAREQLAKLAASKTKVNAIACSQATAGWATFADVSADYPTLGDPRVFSPPTYRWPSFLTASNVRNIAGQIAIIAIIAIGMTLVIITGGIDLSVGSLIALSSVVMAVMLRDVFGGRDAGIVAMFVAGAAALVVCALLGGCTGAIVSLLDLPPFIVTLAMMLVAKGIAGMVSNGQTINQVPASISRLGLGADLFGIPNPVVLMLLLYVLAHVLMSRMSLGRYIYAVGGNREAARLSGVPVQAVVTFVYVASGLFAGLGGILMTSQFHGGSFKFGTDGNYELQAITAVVVGGTSLSGGEGSIFGTLLGAFTIAVIGNGMNMIGVEYYGQLIALGAIILAAVMFDKLRRRK